MELIEISGSGSFEKAPVVVEDVEKHPLVDMVVARQSPKKRKRKVRDFMISPVLLIPNS
jgi:hypothetical protein